MFPRSGQILLLLLIVFFAAKVALYGQQHDHSAMRHAQAMSQAQPATSSQQQELNAATEAMSGHDHEHHMGPHMYMSTMRTANAADTAKAQAIVDSARASLEKYKDVKAAETDGFKIFLPQVKQPMYHFTNYKYAMEAAWSFNPDHPTSLLYEKTGDTYKLIGAMYTAPARFTEDQLNERVPLSVAQWHQHVNLCKPPGGQSALMLQPHAQFGLNGSISTKEACEAAGGTFVPRIFGWMVHLYPNEKTMDAIWSVERQKHGDEMADMPGMKQ
jgi:hypothetical protein